eukprot:COSAG02_NODE_3315_length_6950_cov_190.190629_3_plen_42_part_00
MNCAVFTGEYLVVDFPRENTTSPHILTCVRRFCLGAFSYAL